MGTTEVNQSFTIGSTETITDIDRYRTSANENLAFSEITDYSGSNFSAALPGESVTTFVVSIEGEGKPVEKQEPQTDENGYYFHDTFETDTCGWKGRGAAAVGTVNWTAYEGSNALNVTGRTSKWNGTYKELDSEIFQAGEDYCFSVAVRVPESASDEVISLTLQYNDANGVTQYPSIVSADAKPGEYVVLSTDSFTIPEDASGIQIYVETYNSTTDFAIDEAIGGPAGALSGEKSFVLGDVNSDGKLNVIDAAVFRRCLLNSSFNEDQSLAGDVNGDGELSVSDLVMLQSYLIGKITAFRQE